MKDSENKIAITASGEGQILKIAGGSYRIIMSGEQTNGAFAVIEMSVPPGAGPNPHSHAAFTESFFVLEGEVSFQSESGVSIAKKNSFVNIPTGGAIHGFKNRSNESAKLLCTVMPAGLEDFFREMAALMDDPANTPPVIIEKVKAISEKYGQKLYPEKYFETLK